MSIRSPALPFLPGYSFDPNIGRTKFPRNPQFETIGGVQMLIDKLHSVGNKIESRFPSIYTRGEVAELPGWIAYDKQVLTFDAYFQETLPEVRDSPFQIRVCKIYFYLEDGTIKVVEPKVENSGIPQGTLISRQRISFPPPKDNQFYDIIDINVGREIELYGKVFKITSCDKFTRYFLNRLGVPVPDPTNTPYDPYIEDRKKTAEAVFPKKPNRHVDTFGQFLAYDRHVLRFYGYWDDRSTEGGYIHDLVVQFYMADDTIEIFEVVNECGGQDSSSTFIKRSKLPKFSSQSELPSPGYYDRMTVLNVLGPCAQEGRFVIDPLNCGRSNVKFYKEDDFAIGSALIVYGRKIVLTHCDKFTENYYRTKYGIDNFNTAVRPQEPPRVEVVPLHKRKLPPWNGFGTFEDSAQNCVTVEPKQIWRDVKKFLTLDRDGMDSRILRFSAVMQSKHLFDCRRKFIFYYYLCDDTISIFEVFNQNSGKCFLTRNKIVLPGQRLFTSEPPDYYTPQHMYIGATLNINKYVFILTDADEYALRYMELHPNEFPKSNNELVLNKVREKLKPIYKDFIAENLPDEHSVMPFDKFREIICGIMGDDWTEQELITLARNFSAVCRTDRHSRNFIRQIVLTELKKCLWDDLDRLKEYFSEYDREKTGFLPKKELYTLLKACRVPLDISVIEQMLNVLAKNDKCEIDGNDFFCFLDRNYCPQPDLVPINFKKDLWWASEPEPVGGKLVDWCAFNKALNLEYIFKEPIVVKKKIDD